MRVAVAVLVSAVVASIPVDVPPQVEAPSEVAPAAPAPGVVDGPTARRLVEDGARLLDVRTPEEYAAGHAPRAINIPVEELDRRAAELGGSETPIVVYCRTGRRSASAVAKLREHGYARVWDLRRYADWPAADAAPVGQ